MDNLEVRIVQLEPLHVARAHAFGEGPEHLAWEKLLAWARQREKGPFPTRDLPPDADNPDFIEFLRAIWAR